MNKLKLNQLKIKIKKKKIVTFKTKKDINFK